MVTQAETQRTERIEAVEHKDKRRKRTLTVRRWVILAAIAIGMLLGAYDVWTTHESNQTLGVVKALAAQNKALAAANLASQNHHHAQTVESNAEQVQLLRKLNDEAAVIEYEGGVITYLSGENSQKDDAILAAQAEGHQLLEAVAGLQFEINQDVPQLKAGLNTGQAQINAYLHYLTCLGTNPTNTAVCGAAPPLPATS